MPYPSADALYRQAQWEDAGVRAAVERYRAAAKCKDATELSPGQALLKELVAPLAATISKSQDEAGAPNSDGGRLAPWADPILMLGADEEAAERLAIITISAALRGLSCTTSDTVGKVRELNGVTLLSLSIASSVRDQVEFDRWSEAQRVATKAAKKRGDMEHKDLLRALKLRFPTLSRSAWHRFRGRVEALREGPWKPGQSVALGAHLLGLLTAAAPHRFEIKTRYLTGGRTERYLDMTDETRALMADRTARAEVSRPVLLPMIIPPIPWAYATENA